jgi:hypothetical protein
MHRPRFLARMAKRSRGTKIAGVLAVAGLLTAFGSSTGAIASRGPGGKTGEWQQAITKLRLPGKGCFTAAYPKVAWVKKTCKAAPKHPYPPVHGHRPQIVGNGTDYSAEVTGHLTSVTGSFDSVSAGATETGQQNGSGPQVANTYSLQINAKPFSTSLCTASPNPGCQGWQQFVYSTTFNVVFMQYWLLQYNTTCPSGWTTFMFPMSTDIYCFRNSTSSTLTGGVSTVASLSGTTLTGNATSGGNDSIVMTTPTGHATATAADSLLHLANGWTGVEFTLVGDCCGAQANFSAGTTLKVRTTVHNGTTLAPTCVLEGFTGETNNLNLASTPAISTGPSPAIVSDQTSAAGTPSCAAGDGHGDTHLDTFRDLTYDFQAAGDFEDATTGPKFVVETRQVSGAPSWPNAAVNSAVATHIGKSNVAVCLAPPNPTGGGPLGRLFINHRTVNLPPGAQKNLADGGDVSLDRTGSVYLIRGASGNSVRAQINIANPDYINVSVGLGRWPEAVHGLLANAGTNVTALAARGGAVIHAPFAFNTFYHKYGDSWRVPIKSSLLSDCGEKVQSSDPANLMYADNLDPKQAEAAKALCERTGVKAPALLDACTVDVAVLGTKAAAQIYLHLPPNLTEGKITLPPFNSAATKP